MGFSPKTTLNFVPVVVIQGKARLSPSAGSTGWESTRRVWMKIGRAIFCSMLAALALAGARRVEAEPFTNALYTLLEGITISDDCLICGRPTIIRALRGTFELALLEENLDRKSVV